MLTSEQVERLEALLQKATPGPWQAMNPYQWDSIIGAIDGPDDGDMHYESVTDITSHHNRSRANAALIVAAINALPALLQLTRAVADAPVVRVPKAVEGRLLLIPLSHDFGGQRVRLVPARAPDTQDAG